MVVRLFLAGVCVGSRAQHWFQCVVCSNFSGAPRDRQPNCVDCVWWQACDASCAATVLRCRFAFFGLAQMVMLQHDEGGGLTQTQGPGKPPLIRPGAVEPSPGHVARRGRGLGVGTLVYGHQRSGISRARVNVVRSNAQMGGVPAACPRALYLQRASASICLCAR